jgi:hypothetical protein
VVPRIETVGGHGWLVSGSRGVVARLDRLVCGSGGVAMGLVSSHGIVVGPGCLVASLYEIIVVRGGLVLLHRSVSSEGGSRSTLSRIAAAAEDVGSGGDLRMRGADLSQSELPDSSRASAKIDSVAGSLAKVVSGAEAL